MKQSVCSICSYTYDEAKGIPGAGTAPEKPHVEKPSRLVAEAGFMFPQSGNTGASLEVSKGIPASRRSR